MRMSEIRARYATRVPRRGNALLIWQPGETCASQQESLYPCFTAALDACWSHLCNPRCRALWVYDGQRLYDRAAIERLGQARGS